MHRVALLSNPKSTGNKSLLPGVRSFCAANPDIFHYEVEHADQIGEALKTIAKVKPKVLVINGGDGTVQAAMTELHHGGHFGDSVPPVAVLPNGKTNLIAHDLGADGDPIGTLQKVVELAAFDLAPHIVQRELIQLTDGNRSRPVLGMFLGGAGLAETILFCRHRLYPLGLPNGLSHVLAAIAGFASLVFGIKAQFLPRRPLPLTVSVHRHGELKGRFPFLMVTTLEKLLLKGNVPGKGSGLKLLVIERSFIALVRALIYAIRGRLGRQKLSGVHLQSGDEILLEGERLNLLLDGELFQAEIGRPIVLRPSGPVPFIRLVA